MRKDTLLKIEEHDLKWRFRRHAAILLALLIIFSPSFSLVSWAEDSESAEASEESYTEDSSEYADAEENEIAGNSTEDAEPDDLVTEDEDGTPLVTSSLPALTLRGLGLSAQDFTDEPVMYLDEHGETCYTHVDCIPLSDDDSGSEIGYGSEWATWYYVDETVTWNSRVTISGSVTIILCDGCTLDANKGITVASGNSLTIYGQSEGTGMLTSAEAASGNSAIGSAGNSGGCGDITINGGCIEATGGSNAPGMGSGNNGGREAGSITINRGTVTAAGGGDYGSGLGGGGNSRVETITINGGSITATGTKLGAAIGTGGLGGGENYTMAGSTISINGGTVNATGGAFSAGIGGGGRNGSSYAATPGGTITITGGTVTASSTGFAAGIGGGCQDSDSYTGASAGDITITGGTVNASSTSGAGIGAGNNGESGTLTLDWQNISDCNVAYPRITSSSYSLASASYTSSIRMFALSTDGDTDTSLATSDILALENKTIIPCTKVNSTAYAIYLSGAQGGYADGTLLFFRSFGDYTAGTGTVWDINGVKYEGTVYTGIETSTYSSYTAVPWCADGNYANITAAAVASNTTITPKSTNSKGELNTSTAYWFYYCKIMTSCDLKGLDTRYITTMDHMFYGCYALKSLDVSDFDTSNVTNMDRMFWTCKALTSLDLSVFDTKNVTTMYRMFLGCSALTSLNVSKFDTSGLTGTGMAGMFSGCINLKSLDVSKFDTSGVTSLNSTFYNCSKLTSLDVSDFDTSNIKFLNYTFCGCSGLTSLDVSKFNTSKVTTMEAMFSGCSGLQSLDVSNFDTENVTTTKSMFSGCGGLTSLDVSGFNTSNVTDMIRMFENCFSLTSLDLKSFTKPESKVYMDHMFYVADEYSSQLVTIYVSQDWYGNWDIGTSATSTEEEPTYMFQGCESLVGGNNTGYDSSYKSESYAVIDNSTHAGYFTQATHTHDNVTFTAWTSTTSLPAAAGDYYLTADVTISSTWTVPSGTTNLCLNGHGILMTGTGTVISGSNAPTLNIYNCDSKTEHYVTLSNYRATGVSSSGTESVSGGTGTVKVSGGYIAGGYLSSGSYVGSCINFVTNGGKVSVSNVTILGSYNGGSPHTAIINVRYSNSSLNLSNTNIIYNYGKYIGGVWTQYDASVVMDNCEVKYNKCNGPGILYSSEEYPSNFTVKDCTVEYNVSNRWGVVCVQNNKWTISGDTVIQNNTDSVFTSGYSNMCVKSGVYVNVGALGDDASIGVHIGNSAAGSKGTFTTGYSTDNTEDPSNYFTSDNASYAVSLTSGGEAQLVTAYTVAFNVNGHGTAPDSQTVASGGKVTEPDAPAADGYTFSGWYTDEDCTIAWDFDTDTVSNNMTLYALWTEGVSYIDVKVDETTHEVTSSDASCTDYEVVNNSDSAVTWSEGWYVVSGSDVKITARITCSGAVNLILCDSCKLTASAGITVGSGNSLTVYAQSTGEDIGVLSSKGTDNSAGIGGINHATGGTVTINGGSITATGGSYSAGIGGGNQANGGTVTVNGGKITAQGGSYASGIGAGAHKSGGTLTVNDGTVTATGGNAGSGIGGGGSANSKDISSTTGGTVYIYGGSVTASGGGDYGAADIGGGGKTSTGNSYGQGADVTIKGGTVAAKNGGIGAGGASDAGTASGTLTLDWSDTSDPSNGLPEITSSSYSVSSVSYSSVRRPFKKKSETAALTTSEIMAFTDETTIVPCGAYAYLGQGIIYDYNSSLLTEDIEISIPANEAFTVKVDTAGLSGMSSADEISDFVLSFGRNLPEGTLLTLTSVQGSSGSETYANYYAIAGKSEDSFHLTDFAGYVKRGSKFTPDSDNDKYYLISVSFPDLDDEGKFSDDTEADDYEDVSITLTMEYTSDGSAVTEDIASGLSFTLEPLAEISGTITTENTVSISVSRQPSSYKPYAGKSICLVGHFSGESGNDLPGLTRVTASCTPSGSSAVSGSWIDDETVVFDIGEEYADGTGDDAAGTAPELGTPMTVTFTSSEDMSGNTYTVTWSLCTDSSAGLAESDRNLSGNIISNHASVSSFQIAGSSAPYISVTSSAGSHIMSGGGEVTFTVTTNQDKYWYKVERQTALKSWSEVSGTSGTVTTAEAGAAETKTVPIPSDEGIYRVCFSIDNFNDTDETDNTVNINDNVYETFIVE